MSVFLKNVCKFEGCGEIFKNLNELIEHIETGHIDFDPEVVEQLETESPESIPLSYAVRYSSTDLRKEDSFCNLSPDTVVLEHNYCVPFRHGFGSDNEIDDFDTNDIYEDELDKEFSSEFIMRYGSMQDFDGNNGKPFACPVPGCKKRYKNINGIKYHAKNGHKKNKYNKGLVCHCGKVYKTENGLKNHASMAHGYAKIILPRSGSVFRELETESFLTINKLPSPIKSKCESNGDNCTENTKNNNNDVVEVSSNSEIEALTSSRQAPSVEEKSEVTNKTMLEKINKSDHDDVIDVGDANDCVYPYNC